MEDLELNFKNWQMETMYHQHWLSEIKKKTRARHAIFVREGNDYYIHTHFTNAEGGRDTIKFKLDSAPSELRDFDYNNLIDELKKHQA